MPFSLSLKSLIRLQKRQFSTGKTKRDLAGPIFLLAYIWGVAILIYVLAKDEIPDIPSLALIAICAGLLIFEFVFKLIFVRDETVMDAFLKTQSDRVQATYEYLFQSRLLDFYRGDALEL